MDVRSLRRWFLVWNLALPAGAALLFFAVKPFLERLFRWHFFCPFKSLTHLYCPVCGGTRACAALLTGHPLQSLLLNPVVWTLVLILGTADVFAGIAMAKGSMEIYGTAAWRRARKILTVLLIAVLAGNFLVRNILLVTGTADPIGDLLPFWQNVRP